METERGRIPNKMKAIEQTSYIKDPKMKSMMIKFVDTPKPNENEVLIKVYAFGLNFGDVIQRKSAGWRQHPSIPGYEVSGIVAAVGGNVSEFKIGQKVMALTLHGGYAQYATAKKEAVLPLPEGWSFSEGASVLCNFATAHLALYDTGGLKDGYKVLIHCGAGGVGWAAIQLAKLCKCEVFATCSSDEKVKWLKEQGVDWAINYSKFDFESEVNRITKNVGVDVIVDPIGGWNFRKDLNILRVGGRLVALNMMSISSDWSWRPLNMLFKIVPHTLSMMSISSYSLLTQSKGFWGVNLCAVAEKRTDLLLEILRDLEGPLKRRELRPPKIQEYDWSAIAEAHELLESRKHIGKIVMLIPEHEMTSSA